MSTPRHWRRRRSRSARYWLLALPLGAWLGLRAGFGLAGIWWGLCIGLACVATMLIGFIHWRGPARLAL